MKTSKNIPRTRKPAKGRIKSARLVFAVFLLIASLLVSVISPVITQAKPASEMTLDEKTQSYLYYRTLEECINDGWFGNGAGNNIIRIDKARSGEWFVNDNSGGQHFGYYMEDEIARGGGELDRVSCNSIVLKAVPLWGYASPIDLLCDFKERDNSTRDAACAATQTEDGFTMMSGVWLNQHDSSRSNDFKAAVNAKVYGGNDPELTNPMRYLIFEAAFFSENGCIAKPLISSLRSGMNEGLIYENISYVGWPETTTAKYFRNGVEVHPGPEEAYVPEGYYDIQTSTTTEPRLVTDADFYGIMKNDMRTVYPDTVDPPRRSCGDIASAMTANAGDYFSYLGTHVPEWETLSASSASTCANNSNDPNCQPVSTETSCAITGIGWIVCGVMTAVAGMNDLMYEGIENILLLNPLAVQENGVETPTYQIWKPIRDIANALLVVAFLIIIFSQITNLGVTNYGIKKTLPRIIIVAIAINVSFFVMMIAIDLVNILGSGLHDLISQYSDTAWNAAQSRAGWGTVIDAVLGGTAVAATVGIAVAVSSATAVGMMVLPFLLGAVLAIFAAFVTLALRNALVVVLAIVAPLAFAAFLLPNTKKLYDKWQKLLVSMLFLFPMAALLFSGAKLAGAVIMGLGGTLNIVFGLFIAAAPLFMLPWLAKSSGGILAKVGGQLGKMGKSLQGSAQKGLSPMVQQRKDERRRQLDAGERTLNPFGKVRTPNQTKETAAYKKMKEDFKEGKRAGESTADWDNRRRGLIQGMGRLSQSGDRSRTKQTIAQRLALGRAERESNISRLKKQPAEQLKAMADESGRINSVTGLTNLDSAGYSRGAQRLAQRAASTIETERLSDTRAQIVDTRSKTGFEARHREGVILDSKSAEASLKTEQDRTGKLVEELSTEAGAALNPGLQAAASELHIAHTESQVAQMATDSAKRVATQEFADQIIQPASGLAARAGGIDQQGEARAVSKARAAVASAREESIGNIVNDHKLRPERSARWHLARLGDQDAIEKLRAEGLGTLADEIGLLPPPTEEEETASIRRIKDIGGIGEALSLARLTPYLRTDQARDEAKGVTAPKLGERMPAFLSQMGNMSNAANNSGGLPIFSEEDAWVKYVNGTSFSLEDFITLPQQRDELIKFATDSAASMTPEARQDIFRQLQDMRRQIEQSALAKEKIAPKAIENLDTALQQLENPPAPQQQP